MQVCITDKVSPSGTKDELFLAWRDQDIDPKLQSKKISALINEQPLVIKDIFLEKLSNLFYFFKDRLPKENFFGGIQLWSLNLLFEKSFWKTPGYYDLIKITAIEHFILENEINTLRFDFKSESTLRILKKVSIKNKIKLNKYQNNLKAFITLINLYFLSITTSLIFFMKFVIRNIYFILLKPPIFSNQSFSSVYFIDSVDLDFRNKKEVLKFHEIFRLEDSLCLVFYKESPQISNKRDFLKKMVSFSNNSSQFFIFESFLSAQILIKSLIIYILRLKDIFLGENLKVITERSKVDPLLSLFHKEFFSSYMGKHCLEKIIFIELINTILLKLKAKTEINNTNIKLGYYQENQFWEKALNFYWKKIFNENIFGVVKSSFSFWDLRHNFNKLLFDGFKEFIPKDIFFTNKFSMQNYVHHRSLSLHAVQKRKSNYALKSEDIASCSPLKIVFFGDYLLSNNKCFIDLFNKISPSYDVEIIFKSHPAKRVDRQFTKFIKHKVLLADNYLDLYSLSKKGYIFCFTSSTGAALEARLITHNIIIFEIPNQPNLSPIFNLDPSVFVNNFETFMERINSLSSDFKNNYSKNFDGYFFHDDNIGTT